MENQNKGEIEAYFEKVVEGPLRMLKEHFDSVQIVVTKGTEDGLTHRYAKGLGNWYARAGSVREWLIDGDGEVMAQGANRIFNMGNE